MLNNPFGVYNQRFAPNNNVQGYNMNMQGPMQPYGRQMPQQMPQRQMPQQQMQQRQMPQGFGRQQGAAGQMQQMPQTPQVPLAHVPGVRFEPVPEQFAREMQQGAAVDNTAQASQVSTKVQEESKQKLASLSQGESNSLVYYRSMFDLPGVDEGKREIIAELRENKQKNIEWLSKMYVEVAKEMPAIKEMKVEGVESLKSAVTYALVQESRLLREATSVMEGIGMEFQAPMQAIIGRKIADIAQLMAL